MLLTFSKTKLKQRTTNSEFDDMFGFVAGKMLYFIKGVAVQPYSVLDSQVNNLIQSNHLKLFSSLYENLEWGSTCRAFSALRWKKEDHHSFRTQSSMHDVNFAPRRELGMWADVAFNLHGSTVMFCHFDRKFLQYAIGCKRYTYPFARNWWWIDSLRFNSCQDFEILQDLNVNLQRYATTGALLYTQPNSLPVSVVMSAPILLSLKGSISKLKTPGVVGRRINLSLLYKQTFLTFS